MRVTGKFAYAKFKEEHPLIEISLSVFCDLRPKSIKPLHKTPLDMCQCDKCLNIRNKLNVLNIPGIKMKRTYIDF